MSDSRFLNFVLALLAIIAIGWLLIVGRTILLPIVTAGIAAYVVSSASATLHKRPGLRFLPLSFIRFFLLVAFAAAVVVFAAVVAGTIREISDVVPSYQANITALVERITQQFDLDSQELWDEIREATVDRIDLRQMVLSVLGGFSSVGGAVFVIILYAVFMTSERASFAPKIMAAFPDPGQAQRTLDLVSEINTKISDYLVAKTMINVALGLISYGILWVHDVDFALFWAIMIGLLNYIPYVGSYVGVFFPVVLSLAQFGSLSLTVSLTVFLVAAQFVLGNVIEPRFIGRQINLSPLVVLIALSVWSAMWGLPGAILAVPMTSVLAIVLMSFESTRFLAVFLANTVETPAKPAK